MIDWEDEYDVTDPPDWEPTKAERREARRNNRVKMRVSGRSVFELQRLRARPLKPRRRDTRRGPTSG